MEQEFEKARGEDDSDNTMAQNLLMAADKLELDLDGKEGKKKAAADFVKLVEDILDLPANRDPKLEVGKLVLANAGKSNKEIMQALVEKFGFAEAKKEKAAAKEVALEVNIANPKNAPLIMAFKECYPSKRVTTMPGSPTTRPLPPSKTWRNKRLMPRMP
jgi:hypothetical protein